MNKILSKWFYPKIYKMIYPKIPLAQSIIEICKSKGVEHIVISPGSRNAPLTIGFESNPNFTVQEWLQLDRTKPLATIVALPNREDVQIPVDEQLVVEFCSR